MTHDEILKDREERRASLKALLTVQGDPNGSYLSFDTQAAIEDLYVEALREAAEKVSISNHAWNALGAAQGTVLNLQRLSFGLAVAVAILLAVLFGQMRAKNDSSDGAENSTDRSEYRAEEHYEVGLALQPALNLVRAPGTLGRPFFVSADPNAEVVIRHGGQFLQVGFGKLGGDYTRCQVLTTLFDCRIELFGIHWAEVSAADDGKSSDDGRRA